MDIKAKSARGFLAFFCFQEKEKSCYKESSYYAVSHCVIHIIVEMVIIQIVSRSCLMVFADSWMNYVRLCFGINDISQSNNVMFLVG